MTTDPTARELKPAVAAAEDRGHTVEWDPPWGLTAVRRWTCTRCGDAVLQNGSVIYGGAVERTCEESQGFWARPAGGDGR